MSRLFVVRTDFRQTWIVAPTTLEDESIWRACYSHSSDLARHVVMATDAREARSMVAHYGMAADAGTVAESFTVEMRGRWKAIPVISRQSTMAEAGQ